MPSNNPHATDTLVPFTGRDDPRNGVKPKGAIHISTHIQRLMEDEAFEANILDAKTGLKEYRGAPVKAIIAVAITKAVNGDDKAREWLAKYGWSTKSEVDVTSNGETVSQPIDMDMVTQFMMMAKDQTKQ